MDPSKYDGEIPAELRRQQILSFIKGREFVRVADLSTHFGVSDVTVRSDLDMLAELGQLRRVRGGAIPDVRPHLERPFEETLATYPREKEAIGRAAAQIVTSGQTIILDVGTTTTAVARALIARDNLQDVVIFTPSLNIAFALEPAIPRFTVILTGGTLRPMQHSLIDPLGGLLLERITAHIAFLGCNGIDHRGGVTNINLPETEIKRRMLRASRRIVVADSSKVGQIEVAYLCGADEIDMLITDGGADAGELAALHERNVEIQIAK
ncbi:MAG TPA: DeoR/GlpR family DNA-binding transcription regulator [Ktedonobacterales bacterium]|nr:DeoR/GlpR family DNA-binding transcription regulator [Ktedonobacterales bacterium]